MHCLNHMIIRKITVTLFKRLTIMIYQLYCKPRFSIFLILRGDLFSEMDGLKETNWAANLLYHLIFLVVYSRYFLELISDYEITSLWLWGFMMNKDQVIAKYLDVTLDFKDLSSHFHILQQIWYLLSRLVQSYKRQISQ